MPKCMDKSAKTLSDQGYNLVKYPRADISPLDVIAQADGRFEWLGPINTIWQSKAATPVASQSPASTYKHESSNSYKGAFGIRILDGLLKNLGGAGQAKISKDTTLTFFYSDPVVHAVKPLEVGAFLKDGDIDLDNPFLSAFMRRDEDLASDFYVITEVLRSKKLLISAENTDSAKLKVDVEALEKLANGTMSASVQGQSNKEIVFEGDTMLSFAFKAFEIAYDNGDWKVLGTAPRSGYLSNPVATAAGVILGQSPVALLK